MVHDLYGRGGAAVELVGKAFPGVVIDEAISRPELGKRVLKDDVRLNKPKARMSVQLYQNRKCVIHPSRAPIVRCDSEERSMRGPASC